MKRVCLLWVIIFCFFIAACGGGGKKTQKPQHLVAGTKAIQKGIVWYQKGCYKRALGYFLRAHESFVLSDQLPGVAMSLNNIGNVYRHMNKIANAILLFEESFDIYWDLKNTASAVQVLSNKAAALIADNQLQNASAILSLAKEIAQKNALNYKPLLHNQAILLIKQKEFKQAEKILGQALDTTDATNLSAVATVNFACGTLNLARGKYAEAVKYFKITLAADRSRGFYKGMADTLAALATAFVGLGQSAQAADYYKRSIQIYALIGNKKKVRQTMDAFEKEAKAANLDTRVTKYFLGKWSKGQVFQGPCQ